MSHGKPWRKLASYSVPVEDPDEGLGHVVPIQVYNAVYLSLIALTFFTIWVALHDFGNWNIVIAMMIATLKAAVVTVIFMHLHWEHKIIWGIVTYPIFVFLLILGSTMGDLMVQDYPTPAVKSAATIADEARITERGKRVKEITEAVLGGSHGAPHPSEGTPHGEASSAGAHSTH